MKTTTMTSRIRIVLGTLLLVLAASFVLVGCDSGGNSSNNADHSQHSGHNM